MKIGIAGYGVVGQAQHSIIKDEVIIYDTDPKKCYDIEKAKEEIKSLIRGRQLLWNGITRNVVIAGGFFTSVLQNDKFKDIDIFILDNDAEVYHNLTAGFVRQSMAGTHVMPIVDDPYEYPP